MISIVHGLKEYHLQPKVGARYSYRFETIVDDFSIEKRPIQKSYIRDVQIMPIGKAEYLDVYQIFTAKISIKSNVAVADEYLIKQIGYAFDEIEAGVDYTGKIVRIFNKAELSSRWQKTSRELEKEYEGSFIQSYFSEIAMILKDETKLIEFLSSYKMFGLYFHGLFGNYLLWEMPIVRKKIAEDFKNSEVTEQIHPEKKDFVRYKINGRSNALYKYEGELVYKEYQLQEALIELEDSTQSIKYATLFLG